MNYNETNISKFLCGKNKVKDGHNTGEYKGTLIRYYFTDIFINYKIISTYTNIKNKKRYLKEIIRLLFISNTSIVVTNTERALLEFFSTQPQSDKIGKFIKNEINNNINPLGNENLMQIRKNFEYLIMNSEINWNLAYVYFEYLGENILFNNDYYTDIDICISDSYKIYEKLLENIKYESVETLTDVFYRATLHTIFLSYGNRNKYSMQIPSKELNKLWLDEKFLISFDQLSSYETDDNELFQLAKMWISIKDYNNAQKAIEKFFSLPYTSLLNKEFNFLKGKLVYLEKYEEIHKECAIDYLKKCTKTEYYPEACYILSKIYNDKDDEEKTKYYLNLACENNHPQAIIEYNLKSYNINKEKSKEEITDLLQKQKDNLSREDIANCHYILGKIDNDLSEYKMAAELSHQSAYNELNNFRRKELNNSKKHFLNNKASNYCYTNNLDTINQIFIDSLDENSWKVYCESDDLNAKEQSISSAVSLNTFINNLITNKSYKSSKVIMTFLGDDETKNLNIGLEAIDLLFNKALDLIESDRELLIKATDIYIKANYEYASLLLDASLSDMRDNVYFKAHICDYNRDSSQKLLIEAPIFLPLMKDSYYSNRNNDANIVLIGGKEGNFRLLKEIVAINTIGDKKLHQINLSLFSDNATPLSHTFFKDCPGVSPENQINYTCIVPRFFDCNIETTNFEKLITSPNEDLKLQNETIKNGNYFVIDIGDDKENIMFAVSLRTWLLRNDDNFKNAPFIAVKCEDHRNAYLAKRLTNGNTIAGDNYYNNYNLHCFGMIDTIYSYNTLIDNNYLENQALTIHLSYSSAKDYYSFQYNQDSSKATAIGLLYRLFAVEQDLLSSDIAFNQKNLESLSEKFNDKKGSKAFIEKLCAIEQSRWNGFMLTRGWMSASLSQVEKYADQATGSQHKHLLAKLHPFIFDWDKFDEADQDAKYNKLKKRFNVKKPKATTKENIENTSKFLLSAFPLKELSADREK